MLLAIDCCTQQATVALYKEDQLVGEESSQLQRSHSEFVTVAIENLVKKAGRKISQISQIAVDRGPGSFTGIRVGVGLAKSLSYSLQIPIWTTDSLTVLRAQISTDLPCFASLNAYKNLVFGSFFENQDSVIEPAVFTFAQAAEILEQRALSRSCAVTGDGFPFFESLIKDKKHIQILGESWPRAQSLAQLCLHSENKGQTLDWKSLIPLYLRGSEAEEKLRLQSSESS